MSQSTPTRCLRRFVKTQKWRSFPSSWEEAENYSVSSTRLLRTAARRYRVSYRSSMPITSIEYYRPWPHQQPFRRRGLSPFLGIASSHAPSSSCISPKQIRTTSSPQTWSDASQQSNEWSDSTDSTAPSDAFKECTTCYTNTLPVGNTTSATGNCRRRS